MQLSRAGLRVVVVDKAEFPRDKPCGEGLLPHGLHLLQELGCGDLVEACGGQPFRGILYHCHGVVARGDFADGAVGRGMRRRHLDDAMRHKAQDAGAVLVAGSVSDVVVDADGATVSVRDGDTLRARVVVGADGMRSHVRHSLGLDGGAPRRPRYALRQHFRLVDGAPLPERVEVHVGEHHELYVTPVEPGVVGVAALCERELMGAAAGPPAARMASLIAGCAPLAERLRGAVPVGTAMACGPLRVRATEVFSGRGVLVGDAAGYVDAITGEGMSLALKTSMLAAAAIERIVAGDDVTAAFSAYAKARRAVFRDHALLTFGLVELARRPYLARRVIAGLARDPTLFTRLLMVNDGTQPLLGFGVFNALKLAVGAAPA